MFVCLCLLTWDNEDVPILVSIIGPMPRRTVPNCEPGGLVADQLEMEMAQNLDEILTLVKTA